MKTLIKTQEKKLKKQENDVLTIKRKKSVMKIYCVLFQLIELVSHFVNLGSMNWILSVFIVGNELCSFVSNPLDLVLYLN